MMKYLFILFFCVCSYNGLSQTQPSGLPVPNAPTGYYKIGTLRNDSMYIPAYRDTNFLPRYNGTLVFRPGDKSYYYYDSTQLRWFKLLKQGDAGNVNANNGISLSGDTVQLGQRLGLGIDLAILQQPRFIRLKSSLGNDRSENTALLLGNSDDSSAFYAENFPTYTAPPFQTALMYLSRKHDRDTIRIAQYGGIINASSREVFDSTMTTHDSTNAFTVGIAGPAFNSQIFPPNVSWMKIDPFGQAANAYYGSIDIGGDNAYNLSLRSNYLDYPMATYQSRLDLARTNSNKTRIIQKGWIANYVSDFRSYQNGINAGTTEWGSRIGKIAQFYAYGTTNTHSSSPSKTKTLAVSSIDTSVAFYAGPQYTNTNEVRDGYGFMQSGTQDFNWFAGKLNISSTMPQNAINYQREKFYVANGASRFADSVYGISQVLSGNNIIAGRVMVGGTTTPSARFEVIQRDSINSFPRTIAINSDRFGGPIANGLSTATMSPYMAVGESNALEGTLTLTGTTGSTGNAAASFYKQWTKGAGTAILTGPTTAVNAIETVSSRGGATGNAGAVTLNGWYSAYKAIVQANGTGAKSIEHWADYISGSFIRDGLSTITNRYGLYINPIKQSWVTNGYAIFSTGITDTVRIDGITRHSTLSEQTDTTVYKPMVVDAIGTVRKLNRWPIGSGGSSSGFGIDSTVIGGTAGSVLYVGTNSLLQESNSNFFYDSTNIALGIGTNSISLGHRLHVSGGNIISTNAAGGAVTLKGNSATPRITLGTFATDDTYMDISVSGGINNFDNKARNFSFRSTATASILNILAANGRIGTVGVTAPTAFLHTSASTTAAASLRVPTGTAPTSPNEGDIWSASNFIKYYNGTSTLRVVLTTDATATAGQILQGDGTTYSQLALGTANQLLRVNAGATALEYFTPTFVSDNLATSNLTQDAEARTYDANGQSLLFNNASIFTTLSTANTNINAGTHIRLEGGVHLKNTQNGDADLTVTDNHLAIYQDTLTTDRTYTMPAPNVGGVGANILYIRVDNNENGNNILLAGTTVKDAMGNTITQLDNKTVYTLIAENNTFENYWKVASVSGINYPRIITATATLDFPDTGASASSDLTITLTGAADGDAVSIGVPNGSTLSNGVFTAWVSASNTVTVRFTNPETVSSLNPASGTFRATVIKQ